MKEQIKLIDQKSGETAVGELENATNEWLKRNAGKQIIDISLVWYPSYQRSATGGMAGWIILIRYRSREGSA